MEVTVNDVLRFLDEAKKNECIIHVNLYRGYDGEEHSFIEVIKNNVKWAIHLESENDKYTITIGSDAGFFVVNTNREGALLLKLKIESLKKYTEAMIKRDFFNMFANKSIKTINDLDSEDD